jgi:hypothetical protein
MHTYTTLGGREISLPALPKKVSAFIARCQEMLDLASAKPAELVRLIYGPENPILDHEQAPGISMVTPAVFADPIRGTVYRVLADILFRKEVAAKGQDPTAIFAAYTVDVPTAAKELGLTQPAIRAAIDSWKLGAVYRNGQWWLRPESLASYKVSKAGRPKKASPAGRTVLAKVGGAPGASLSVRVAGGELVRVRGQDAREFPEGWTSALVKTTSEAGVRVVRIEPSDTEETIEHHNLFVKGPFRIASKWNNTRDANRHWRENAPPVTARK